MNDWIANEEGPVPVSSHCFNYFSTRTGGGAEFWEIKLYGDKTVWVALNGVTVGEVESQHAAQFEAVALELCAAGESALAVAGAEMPRQGDACLALALR